MPSDIHSRICCNLGLVLRSGQVIILGRLYCILYSVQCVLFLFESIIPDVGDIGEVRLQCPE